MVSDHTVKFTYISTYSKTLVKDRLVHYTCYEVTLYGGKFSAPSAAPTSVSVPEEHVTFSSITVQWGAVDCIDRNGVITGYSVRYGVQGSGSTQTMNVSGGDTRQTTILDLSSSTTYSIQVAAVNSAGIGVYSTSHIIQTAGE